MYYRAWNVLIKQMSKEIMSISEKLPSILNCFISIKELKEFLDSIDYEELNEKKKKDSRDQDYKFFSEKKKIIGELQTLADYVDHYYREEKVYLKIFDDNYENHDAEIYDRNRKIIENLQITCAMDDALTKLNAWCVKHESREDGKYFDVLKPKLKYVDKLLELELQLKKLMKSEIDKKKMLRKKNEELKFEACYTIEITNADDSKAEEIELIKRAIENKSKKSEKAIGNSTLVVVYYIDFGTNNNATHDEKGDRFTRFEIESIKKYCSKIAIRFSRIVLLNGQQNSAGYKEPICPIIIWKARDI